MASSPPPWDETEPLEQAFEEVAAAVEGRAAAAKSKAERVAHTDLARRLRLVRDDYSRLRALNAQLSERSQAKTAGIQLDKDRGEFVITFGNEQRRVPIPGFVKGMTTFGATAEAHGTFFPAGESPQKVDKETASLRAEFERVLEHFYIEAFRAQKVAHDVTGKKFPRTGVTIVRNDLLEHAKDKDTVLNFGHGTQGPIVRPLVSSKNKDDLPIDPGLGVNAKELVDELRRRFVDQ